MASKLKRRVEAGLGKSYCGVVCCLLRSRNVGRSRCRAYQERLPSLGASQPIRAARAHRVRQRARMHEGQASG